MIKNILAAMLLMGTVASGLAQVDQHQHQHAYLSLVDVTQTSITLEVTAGDLGTPYGFLVSWSVAGGIKHNVVFDGSRCPEYSLPPLGTVEVTINGLTNSGCVVNEIPQPLPCGKSVRFLGRLVGIDERINGLTTFTDSCD